MKQYLWGGILASSLLLYGTNVQAISEDFTEIQTQFIETLSTTESSAENHYIFYNGTITKYIGPGGTVAIPATINGQAVTSIGAEAFAYNSYITIVAMPESVTSIDAQAFKGCNNLTTVNFSSALRSIGSEAFAETGVQSLDLPDTLQSIGQDAFLSCYNLVYLNLPSSLMNVGGSAFSLCSSLSEVVINTSSFSNSASADTYDSIFLNWYSTVQITFYGSTYNSALQEFVSNNGHKFISLESGETTDPDVTVPTYPEWSGVVMDVPSDSWYAHHVAYVLSRGVMSVDWNGYFYPTASCDRQTIADSIVNLLEVSTVGVTHSFVDISSSPYESAIAWCASEGLLSGYDSAYFGPEDYLTRQQFSAMLRSLARYLGINTAVLEDYVIYYHDGYTVASWARTSMMWAVEQGFMVGEYGYLNPNKYVTRTEVAIMLRTFALKYAL